MTYIDTPSQVELNSQPLKCVLLLVSCFQTVEWGRQGQQLSSEETRQPPPQPAQVSNIGGRSC